ncbi:hypothetical protein BH10PSE16_BH10PSE16_04250 [soil metagenome]
MPSIISEKVKARSNSSRSLPVSGHIRSGTQALIKSAAQAIGAKDLYTKAASGVMSFKDAEKAILDKNPTLRKAFTPKNTQYFSLYAHETEGGQTSVDNIMQRYGEVTEEDRVPRLYQIPVVFPPTPAGVEGFFKSEYSMAVGTIKYRSEYGDDGIRRCVYLKPIDFQEQAKRKKFLRRESTIRKDCDPSTCDEFGSGACKFRGRIHFYIPGVIGSGTFVFETGSANACEDIFMRLEDLQRSVRGVLPSFDPNGNPVFFLTKERKKVSYVESGVEKTGMQWVPVLQTTLIKSNILMLEEKERLQLAPPAAVPKSSSAPPGWLGASFGQSVHEGVFTGAGPDDKLTPESKTDAEKALWKLNVFEEENQLPIAEYGEAKYGENWHCGDDVLALHKDVTDMIQSFGGNLDVVRIFLPLMTLLLANKIPVKELAFPYFKSFFGEFKKRHVPDAMAHTTELLKRGSDATIAHMKAQLQIAA